MEGGTNSVRNFSLSHAHNYSPAFWQRDNSITFYGFFDAQSGFGLCGPGLSGRILQAGYSILSVTVSAEVKDGRFETTPDVRSNSSKVDVSKRNKVNIFFINADMIHRFFWDQRLHLLDDSFKERSGIWGWELAHFRPDWASAFGSVRRNLVFSDFCREFSFDAVAGSRRYNAHPG